MILKVMWGLKTNRIISKRFVQWLGFSAIDSSNSHSNDELIEEKQNHSGSAKEEDFTLSFKKMNFIVVMLDMHLKSLRER